MMSPFAETVARQITVVGAPDPASASSRYFLPMVLSV